MTIDRRSCLKLASLAPVVGAVPRALWAGAQASEATADYTIRIATGFVDLAPDDRDLRPRTKGTPAHPS
jgi:hypothetical protein